MPFEYQALTMMTCFFLVAWLPASAGKWTTFGPKWLASNRNPQPGKELSGWGARAERAHNNLKDNFPGFIVAIVLLGILGKFDLCTAWVSGIYVAARLLHFGSYVAGNVPLRALGFFTGLISNLILLIKILF